MISHILSQGHVGVLLFNMITGFVLTLPAGPTGRLVPRYKTFLRQRFLRICPNYYLSLLFWTGVAVIVGGGSGATRSLPGRTPLFVHTFDPAVFFDIVPAYWWMGLMRSSICSTPACGSCINAGVQRQPQCFCACSAGGWLVFTVLARLLPGSLLALAHYLLYFNLPYRLPEFAIGMCLATRWQGSAGSATVHRQGTALQGVGYIPGAHRARALGTLCVTVARHADLLGRCLSEPWSSVVFTRGAAALGAWPPMARATATSFSFYLLHQPVIGYSTLWVKTAMPPFAAFVVFTVCAGVVSLLMSVVLDNVVARLQTTSGASRYPNA